MKIRLTHTFFVILIMIGSMPACKKWEDHNAITDSAVAKNVFEQIKDNPELSRFAQLLEKSGYDTVISSSKTFSVFAPDNAALASLDPAIENNAAQLKLFVSNHISNQSYFLSGTTGKQRIIMLNEKYNNVMGQTIENVVIKKPNQIAKNGVLHQLSQYIPYLDNIWVTMEKNTTIPQAQKNYLLSLFRKVFDTSNAVQIGVDQNTGKPIYEPGTDSVVTNLFWRNVYDLRNEQKEYSLFILSDAAWASELNKFRPYHVTGTVDSTTQATSWTVVKDLAVESVFATPLTIPDTLLSKYLIKVPVDKSSIIQTIKTSNGNIYMMGKVDVQPKDKIAPLKIEAENFRTTSIDRRNNTYYRDRFNPVTNNDFKDVLFYNHGVALFNVNYRLNNMYSTKYKAYWVAVNDFQTATFTQKLGIGIPTSTVFGYTNVTANNYNEVLIGEFTLSSFQPFLDIFLTAASSTTATANPVVCDYIRLEPVF